MRYLLWGAILLAALYCLHRIALWAERRGWIYYRERSGSSGALGTALLDVHATLEPSKRYVIEERARDDAESEEAGGPPTPGKSRGA